MDTRTATLELEGMTCANCASTIENRLGDLDGVDSVDANFATDGGSVEYDPEAVSLSTIYHTVADAGYEAATGTVTVGVADMSCANCAETIEETLTDSPGVVGAEVNFATDEASVTYNPADTALPDIYDAIERAGYTPVRTDADSEESDEARRAGTRDAERRRLFRLTLFGAVLSFPLLVLMAGEVLAPGLLPETVLGLERGWVAFLLTTPVQAVLGKQYYANSYKAVVHNRTANMDVLIALGSSTAYLYSVGALVGLVASTGLYFDTAAFILVFITLGNYLEARSKSQAGEAIRELLEMEADTATLVDGDGTEREVPIEDVTVGDTLKVRPGEKIPTDGVVVDGESAVDEAVVTGESVPVEKRPGEEVIGSTINENGVLVVEATQVGEETAIQQIVERVRSAQSRQPDIQNVADRISAYFVPAVIGNAIIWATIWSRFPDALAGLVGSLPLWGLAAGGPATVGVSEFALVVFASAVLIACPCALGLATPAATMVGTAIGARNGVLFEGGDILERVRDVDTAVFDKTGTLTEGEMELTDVIAVDDAATDGGDPGTEGPTTDGGDPGTEGPTTDGGVRAKPITERFVLELAASAEYNSEHPLADAIVTGAREREIPVTEPGQFENVPGHGVKATTTHGEVLVGNRKLLADEGIDIARVEEAMDRLEREGKTAMAVALEDRAVGVVADADTVKSTAAEAVSALRERGLDVWMITGDNERTARAVAQQVGIDPENVRAGVLPGEKADAVEDLQSDGRRAMMVGDGVNDAPALAAASVGIALGSGTDVAIEAADVTLMREDPGDVLKTIRISAATMSKIKQNLVWALGYNTTLIPLASLGLLQPVLAAGAMAISSVSVLANSLAFRRYEPDHDYRLLNR